MTFCMLTNHIFYLGQLFAVGDCKTEENQVMMAASFLKLRSTSSSVSVKALLFLKKTGVTLEF